MKPCGLEQAPNSLLCPHHPNVLGHGDGEESSCHCQRTYLASPNGQLGPDAMLWLSLTCHLLSSGKGNTLVQETIRFSVGDERKDF